MLRKYLTVLLVALLPTVIMFAKATIDQSQTTIMMACKAPLRGDWPEEEIVPHIFSVILSPGHSLEAHSEAIHRDLTPYVSSVLHDTKKHRVLYGGERVDDEILRAIRADLGAEEVWKGARVHLAIGSDIG